MRKWLLGCARRYLTFFLFVVGAGRAASWLLGADDEMKAFLSGDRALVIVLVALSFIIYAMYDALQEPDR